ncbi:hypothetical protein BB559_001327 [Furculomyces boomerangus]|uniref:Glycosyltransferase family 15 protein n=2 Tax=Harpellales TaxID=61421 RepID=A0A2T9Z2B9_9FUNG|nr:hypothetical protein BB559_001327 [Furculomyces boomerangus]PVZ98781.1 hypothetical protein BB558_005207 [Smittium angustum]
MYKDREFLRRKNAEKLDFRIKINKLLKENSIPNYKSKEFNDPTKDQISLETIEQQEFRLEKTINYNLFLKNFSRLPNWPTKFPSNLTEYRNLVNKSNFSSKYEQWKFEIAPWIWHHKGNGEDNAQKNGYIRQKAAFVVLVRNNEYDSIMHSMRQLEDRFNHKYTYPYIFLNNKPFTKDFMDFISKSTNSNVTFAIIPKDHWEVPDPINIKNAQISQKQMAAKGIPYADSTSYRQMCRFNSGFFYKHPLLADLEFYWRLEPDIDFYCDIDYDPFKMMKDNNKKYAFVIFLKEIRETVTSLWDHTLRFAKETKIQSNIFKMFSTEDGKYNMCHFWSNFEIASLDFFRSEEYESYFNYLDKTGNFFYERWGDAPVHSLAAGLFLDKDEIIFMEDIGYRHDKFARWPDVNSTLHNSVKCRIPKNIVTMNKNEDPVNEILNFDHVPDSCIRLWKEYNPKKNLWTEYHTDLAIESNLDSNGLFEKKNALSYINDRRRWLRLIN